MIDTMMTTKEVARRLNANVAFVLNAIHSGKLEAHQLGKGYRISEQALREFLERTKVGVK